jgi:hypothetical protein
MITIDDFLPSYQALKDISVTGEFSDIENPVDSVVYPHIFKDVPDHLIREVESKLNEIFGSVVINTIFMRRSPKGVKVPHMAHTDNSMGDYSLMLYMQDNDDAGTALIRHKRSGITYAPESETFVDVVRHDQNNPDQWQVYQVATMKENRAAIFDAHLFHCALPVGGFGEGAESRCVLTAFFSVKHD